MPRKWSRARQARSEKPQPPAAPEACECGDTRYYKDQDDDDICWNCGRMLVCWSRYRWEMQRWKKGQEALTQVNRGGRPRKEAA